MAADGEREFNPNEHLIDLQGRKYLPVAWRLYWLRQVQPEAVIETEALTLTADLAVFKATVRLPSGASATGHGTETPKDFRDFCEKAETKSLGRALAALGFGTQFAMSDFDDVGAIADAPQDTRRPQPERPATAAQVAAINGAGRTAEQARADYAKLIAAGQKLGIVVPPLPANIGVDEIENVGRAWAARLRQEREKAAAMGASDAETI